MINPFENDTNKVIGHLAQADLRHNKMKRKLAMIAIVLATILMSLAIFVPLGMDTMTKSRQNPYVSYYHGMVSSVTLDEVEQIKEHADVEELGVTTAIGAVKTQDSILNINYGDATALAYSSVHIEQGRLPDKENEIAIEKDYLHKLGIISAIGDEITLAYTKYMSTEMIEKSFVISGFIKTSATGSNRPVFAGIVSEEYVIQNHIWDQYKPSVLYCIKGANALSVDKITDKVKQVTKDIGLEKEPFVNEGYLNILHLSAEIILVASVIVAIIIFSAALVIYCIFYIALISQIRQYGQLITIGMTNRQIKQMLFKEAKILSIQAIPIGILIGVGIAYCTIPKGINIRNLLICIPLITVLTYLTVYFSVMKPVAILGSISPVESAKYLGKKPKRKKVNKSVKKFSLRGLANNQNRSRRKQNMITVLSISLIGTLLISLATLLSSMELETWTKHFYSRGEQYQVMINPFQDRTIQEVQEDNPFSETLMKSFKQIEGIKKITTENVLPITDSLESEEDKAWLYSFIEEDMAFIQENSETGKKYSYEELSNNNHLIVTDTKKFEQTFGYIPQVGDAMTLKIFEGDSSKVESFEIVDCLKEDTINVPFEKRGLGIAQDTLKRLVNINTIHEVNLEFEENQAGDANEMLLEVIKDLGDTVYMDNYFQMLKTNEAMLVGLSVALGIAMLFLGGFAMINLANNITTNIIIRKREFAMMQAIGMTYKQLRRMMLYENMLVVSKGVSISLVLGTLIGVLICWIQINNGITFMVYHFPWQVASIFVLLAVSITFLVTDMALKSSEKQSLIERIRKN